MIYRSNTPIRPKGYDLKSPPIRKGDILFILLRFIGTDEHKAGIKFQLVVLQTAVAGLTTLFIVDYKVLVFYGCDITGYVCRMTVFRIFYR